MQGYMANFFSAIVLQIARFQIKYNLTMKYLFMFYIKYYLDQDWLNDVSVLSWPGLAEWCIKCYLDQDWLNDVSVLSWPGLAEWCIKCYLDQDWLNAEFDEMDVTVESLKLGDQWLHQMGSAARRVGMTVQYCMSPTRHILTSLQLPAVTQVYHIS